MKPHRSCIREQSALALAALLAVVPIVGCGSDSGPDRDASSSPSTDDDEKDAGGKKVDAGKGGKDAGPKRDARVDPVDPTPKPMPDDEPPVESVNLDECGNSNPGGISSDDVARLKAGGKSDGMRWLYPYDGTVFPRGIGAPLLMWEGAGGQAVYVHIKADNYEYQGCLQADEQGRLQVPKSAWDAAERVTVGSKSPFVVELSTLEGKTVKGPIKNNIVIARATLKGSIYYNSYNTAGGAGAGGFQLGGVVERIKPGQQAEFFSRQGECTGCHSVSANGKRLVTKEVLGVQPGFVFDIDSDTPTNPEPLRTANNASFVGLSPDGSVYLTTGWQSGVGPPTEGALPVIGALPSQLFETDTGNAIANSGFPETALMPTFSPDGTLATFNDFASGGGKGLSLMDYDSKGRKASNLRSLYTSTDGFLGWPFVLPDNGGVVFTNTESSAFSGGGSFITPVLTRGPKSDLMMVDVETGQATILAKAMGFATPQDAAANESYLPFGDEELHMAYYPTVSPVASGGYFWVFFDSIRHYGNMGLKRQLWGTAIRIQRRADGEFRDDGVPLYAADFSSPAFYVPGQVFETANHRAFTALDPCLAMGEKCETGIDCCGGFCTDGICGPPKECAGQNEACKTDDDCCDDSDQCIAGFCGTIPI
jgi:hypothetical protein